MYRGTKGVRVRAAAYQKEREDSRPDGEGEADNLIRSTARIGHKRAHKEHEREGQQPIQCGQHLPDRQPLDEKRVQRIGDRCEYEAADGDEGGELDTHVQRQLVRERLYQVVSTH